MRITGGIHRGRVLEAPGGRQVRPTSDRVREALFSILGARLDGARVLDLFAGSGALGLDALSRGATSCRFVEEDRRVCDLIRRNIASLGLEERCDVVRGDAFSPTVAPSGSDGPFDLVLIDPPYRMTADVTPVTSVGRLLTRLWVEGIVDVPAGLVVLEHDRRARIDETWEHFVISDTRTYGDTSLTFMTGIDADE